MATLNSTANVPTVPVSWLDGLNQANRRLEAFQALVVPFVLSQLSGDSRQQTIAAGMDDMLDDILDLYRDVSGNIEGLMRAYRDAGLTRVPDDV